MPGTNQVHWTANAMDAEGHITQRVTRIWSVGRIEIRHLGYATRSMVATRGDHVVQLVAPLARLILGFNTF